MSDITRFGVSIESHLVEAFDALSKKKGFANRSDALRQCMRNALQEEANADPESNVSGVLSIIYDHHNSDLSKKLTSMQHAVHEVVMTNLHVHLDLHHCLEVMILKGKNHVVQELADKLASTRGILKSNLAITSIDTLAHTCHSHDEDEHSHNGHDHAHEHNHEHNHGGHSHN